MAEVQQQEGRREGDNGQLGGEASPSRHSDYHGVPLPSPERPAGRLAEAPGGGGGKMASAGVQTEAATPALRTEQRAALSSAASTPRGTPGIEGMRRSLLQEGAPLRAGPRSPHATGLQTFGSKYMPFAAGFSAMAGEAPVYRSSRLHSVNPTAAVSEDTSYLYTLDSGAETPATRAANPNKRPEHVRNTAAATQAGGFVGKVFQARLAFCCFPAAPVWVGLASVPLRSARLLSTG